MVITIASIILVVGMLFIVFGYNKNHDACAAGALIILFDLIFGFGLLATVIPVKTTRTEIASCQYLYTSTALIVEAEECRRTFTKASEYNIKRPKIFHVYSYNSYGFVVEESLSICEALEPNN